MSITRYLLVRDSAFNHDIVKLLILAIDGHGKKVKLTKDSFEG